MFDGNIIRYYRPAIFVYKRVFIYIENYKHELKLNSYNTDVAKHLKQLEGIVFRYPDLLLLL